LTESSYIREFVSPGGDAWVDRFYAIRDHPLVDENYQNERLGLAEDDIDPYERNNRWALYSSMVRGVDKVKLIALWNGRGGIMKDRDACIVKHMVDFARENAIAVELINTSKYIHGEAAGAYNVLPDIRIPPGGMAEVVKPKVKSKSKRNKK
jgi:hypothetical protein